VLKERSIGIARFVQVFYEALTLLVRPYHCFKVRLSLASMSSFINELRGVVYQDKLQDLFDEYRYSS
jgi:hypothetical protein